MEQWRTELYHSGILGMKWGHRNGPPYPLTGAQRSGAEKKGGSPIAKAIRTLTDSGYRKRVAAAKKAQITRAKKKQREEDRTKALKKGTASDVLKYRGEVSNKELQDAIDRIKLENQLEDLDRARLSRSQKYVDDFFGTNGVGRVAGYAKNVATLVTSLSTIDKFVNGGNAAASKGGEGKTGGKKSPSNSNSNSGGKKTEQKPNGSSVFGVPITVVTENGAAVEAGKKRLDDEKLGDLWETYISNMDEDIKHSAIYSDELYHYGVKGMKWGKHLKRHNAEAGDDIHGRPETDAQIGFKAGLRVGATQERLRQERGRVHQHASLTRNDQYSRRVTSAMEKSKERSARKTAIKKKVTTFIDRVKSLDLSRLKREGAPLLSYGIDYVTRLLHGKKKDPQEGRPNRQNNVGPKSFKHSYSDELYHYGVKGMKWGKHLKAHTIEYDSNMAYEDAKRVYGEQLTEEKWEQVRQRHQSAMSSVREVVGDERTTSKRPKTSKLSSTSIRRGRSFAKSSLLDSSSDENVHDGGKTGPSYHTDIVPKESTPAEKAAGKFVSDWFKKHSKVVPDDDDDYVVVNGAKRTKKDN